MSARLIRVRIGSISVCHLPCLCDVSADLPEQITFGLVWEKLIESGMKIVVLQCKLRILSHIRAGMGGEGRIVESKTRSIYPKPVQHLSG